MRSFPTFVLLLLLAGGIGQSLEAHEEHSEDSNPLACNPTFGETCYSAIIDDFHTLNSPHPAAIGQAFLVLNAERTQLRYQLKIEGLNLKPVANRTALDDVIGVHFHLYVPDTFGPHVLNIFGLATYGVPAEEDADLVIDYEHQTLSGIYDDGDATIDPMTGQPYFQFYPLTSKPLTDWLDVLASGQLMVAVHSVASGFPTMALHGHIRQSVPEPSASTMALVGVLVFSLAAHKKSRFHHRSRFDVQQSLPR